jgi:hypothetical protein
MNSRTKFPCNCFFFFFFSIARLLNAIAGKGAIPVSAIKDASLTPAWNSLRTRGRICDAIVRPWARRMIASAACVVPDSKVPDELREATTLRVRMPNLELGNGKKITREMVFEKYGNHMGDKAVEFLVRLHNNDIKEEE